MSDIGEQIRHARKSRGLTVDDLVTLTEQLGSRVHPDTIGRIERGITTKPRVAEILQRALKIGPWEEPAPATPVRGRLLEEASVPELAAALIARHEADLRAALGNGAALHVLDETPPDVVTRARRGDIPSGKQPPNEGTSPD